MKTAEQVLNGSVSLLPLIGPISILLSLLLIIFSDVSITPALLVVAAVGLLLSWQWTLRGCLVSYGLLTLSVGYSYLSGAASDPLWMIGYAATLALAFAITAWSIQEVDSSLDDERLQATTDREKILQEVQDTLKSSEEVFSKEIEVLTEKVAVLEQVREKRELEIASYEKLVEISRTELIQSRTEHEKDLNELYRKKHEVGLLEQQLEDTAARQIAWDEQKKLFLQKEAVANDKIKALIAEKEVLAKENTALSEGKDRYEELFKQEEARIKEFMEAIEKMKQQLANPEPISVDGEELDLNTKEGKALRRSQGMYKQLREQFEEKSSLLDQSRYQLFHTEEKLETLKREYEEQLIFDRTETEAAMSNHLLHLVHQQQEAEREIASLHALIEKLQAG